MRKIIINCFMLAAMTLLAAGCKKELIQEKQEEGMLVTAERHGSGGDCHLTQYFYYNPSNGYEQIDNFTYKNGLVDEWTAFYGATFKMEYDKHKKMKTAGAYIDGELLATIRFIHKNNKVVKEIWYVGDTEVIDDEVINSYNKKGELIKNESLNYDYYTINTYTPQGYLESWAYFSGGIPIQKNVYTYKENIKNPYEAARPGIEYSFAWINSGFGSGKRWYSSEKFIGYDENSNPVVVYDQDPNQTKWQRGQQNFPLRADYVDLLSGGSIVNSFEYENCGSCKSPSIAHRPQKNSRGNGSAKSFSGVMNARFKKIAEKLNAMKLNKK